MRLARGLLLITLFSCSSVPRRSADVPSPEKFFGHAIGQDRKLVRYPKVVEYLRELERRSDRIKVVDIGETTQKKRIVMAVLSTPANLARSDRWREIAATLAAGRIPEKEARALAREGKVVLFQSFGLHSDEIGGTQTAPELAYRLVTEAALDDVIVLLVPCVNPDGQEMICEWYDRHAGTEFQGGPMPWLYHPYAGHDNNRDWFMMNLAETRAVSEVLWKTWNPQVIVDHHQMGSTGARMFVPPFTDPANPNVHPLVWRWQSVFGAAMARDLEAAGKRGVASQYVYDAYWPGTLDNIGWWHNRIGILTETASCRIASPIRLDRGEVRERELKVLMPSPWEGGTWRLRDIVDYQLVAALAAVESASKEHEKILYDSWAMANQQVRSGHGHYAVRGCNPAVTELARILEASGVDFERVGDGVKVPLAQANRPLIEDLFQRQVYPSKEKPYDMAGWTLPLQMGLIVVRDGEPGPPDRMGLDLLDPRAVSKIRERLARGEKVTLGAWSLAEPRLGVYKPWVASMDEGWTRLVLDRFGYTYASLDNARVKKGGLRAEFDCIVLPDVPADVIRRGRDNGKMPDPLPKEYRGGIGDEGVAALKKFVEEGGTILFFDGACELAIAEWPVPARNVLKDDREFACPGSVLRVELDLTHPLAWGMPERAMIFFADSPAFATSPPPNGVERAVVARYPEKENPLESGWLQGREKIQGRAALVEVMVGKGRLVLFGFRPQHRAQTWGTFRLLFNALWLSAARRG